ncbi:hypothetical protein [Undibacterium sp.]|jgi:hypothetical protein|uniref:hypothetical protein n=1 Tax=Undibacterium sp. TaxID=1914977 RepID=UPI002C341473|nr:hypothetical protein [Undibacterium sp.]HTD04125.1 hypothetical protein [Undibacterium sp.]
MIDSRSSPRSNVSWRAAVLIAPGNIVPAKVLNIASAGIQLQCAHRLIDGQVYQMMMEVPEPRDASQRTQVVCKASCSYTILSGSEYRAGMKLMEVPPQHQPLLGNWGGRSAIAA